MKEYICTLCEKIFNDKSNYNRHINRKKSCVENKIINENKNEDGYTCEHCERNFSRIDNLKRHYLSCKSKLNKIDQEFKQKQIDQQQKQLDQQQKQIELMEKMIMMLANNNNINNSYNKNSNNTTININNIINVNPYLNNNYDYINDKQKIKVLNKKLMAVTELSKLLNCNPDHPENFNIIIENVDDKYFTIIDENGKTKKLPINKFNEYLEYIIGFIKNFLDEKDHLFDYFKKNKIKELIDAFTITDDKNSKLIRNHVSEETKNMFVEHKDLIKNKLNDKNNKYKA
jgi:hypothetical protein